MVKQKLDKETRKVLLSARSEIEKLMGYDRFKNITAEYAIHSGGETVHCDLAIQLDQEESSKPEIVIEIKRANIDLSSKHLRQAASYAIDIGCEWLLLTNSKTWKLYHVLYDKPPQTKLIDSWDIINDDPSVLSQKLDMISYKNLKKGGLSLLWEIHNVLSAENILKVILSEDSLTVMRKGLKKKTDVTVSPEDIVGAIRHLLNEAALTEMGKIKISLPEKKPHKRATPLTKVKDEVLPARAEEA
ncbi:type I restriction enzyme HsdR N-terminal domain-containing protein [Chloroflexota bacterium]